jgi:hypothetical protein
MPAVAASKVQCFQKGLDELGGRVRDSRRESPRYKAAVAAAAAAQNLSAPDWTASNSFNPEGRRLKAKRMPAKQAIRMRGNNVEENNLQVSANSVDQASFRVIPGGRPNLRRRGNLRSESPPTQASETPKTLLKAFSGDIAEIRGVSSGSADEEAADGETEPELPAVSLVSKGRAPVATVSTRTTAAGNDPYTYCSDGTRPRTRSSVGGCDGDSSDPHAPGDRSDPRAPYQAIPPLLLKAVPSPPQTPAVLGPKLNKETQIAKPPLPIDPPPPLPPNPCPYSNGMLRGQGVPSTDRQNILCPSSSPGESGMMHLLQQQQRLLRTYRNLRENGTALRHSVERRRVAANSAAGSFDVVAGPSPPVEPSATMEVINEYIHIHSLCFGVKFEIPKANLETAQHFKMLFFAWIKEVKHPSSSDTYQKAIMLLFALFSQ